MPIELACTSCGRTLRVADDAAGKHARCPACGAVSKVPASATAGGGPAPSSTPPPELGPAPGTFTPPKPQPAANPFSDATAKAPSFGQPGVNPFAESAPFKGSANPYAPPSGYGYARPQQHQLASRGKRFLGALLDGVFHLVGAIPGAVLAMILGIGGADEDVVAPVAIISVGLGVFVVAVINWVLIARTGQSMAKRVLGMKIVRIDSPQPVGFVNGVALRIWVPALINQACSLFGLVNALWIFNEEQRCIHDLIASTVVIDV